MTLFSAASPLSSPLSPTGRSPPREKDAFLNKKARRLANPRGPGWRDPCPAEASSEDPGACLTMACPACHSLSGAGHRRLGHAPAGAGEGTSQASGARTRSLSSITPGGPALETPRDLPWPLSRPRRRLRTRAGIREWPGRERRPQSPAGGRGSPGPSRG